MSTAAPLSKTELVSLLQPKTQPAEENCSTASPSAPGNSTTPSAMNTEDSAPKTKGSADVDKKPVPSTTQVPSTSMKQRKEKRIREASPILEDPVQSDCLIFRLNLLEGQQEEFTSTTKCNGAPPLAPCTTSNTSTTEGDCITYFDCGKARGLKEAERAFAKKLGTTEFTTDHVRYACAAAYVGSPEQYLFDPAKAVLRCANVLNPHPAMALAALPEARRNNFMYVPLEQELSSKDQGISKD